MNIYLDNISFTYPDQTILEDVSLTLQSGEFVCLLGRNGSGKTTLMKIASGRLKPSAGSITVSERNSQQVDSDSLKRYFSILPQGIQDPPYLSAEAVLQLGTFDPSRQVPLRISPASLKSVNHAIEVCEIERFRNRSFNQLSGGEKQRVWIAFCLVQEKPFLLLDESLHALDFMAKEDFFMMLSKLAADGSGVILSTHDVALAKKYASRIVYLNDRKIAYDGPGGDDLEKAIEIGSPLLP